jgi:hypothetical protein
VPSASLGDSVIGAKSATLAKITLETNFVYTENNPYKYRIHEIYYGHLLIA